MESKDPLLPFDSLSGLHNRVRLPHLTLESTSKFDPTERISLVTESTVSSPSASMSPRTPADTPLSASTDAPPDSPNADTETIDSPSESVRMRSSGNSASTSKSRTGEPREKRKRSRVTPEQLTHLERFFAADRSPTAARRREISELLGMQERQTQIWFQNRRAKAKLLDGKKSRYPGGEWTETPPDTPPQLSAGFEADLHSLIHEDQPISIIPCTDLSVGSWRRIATGKHDLVAYVCEAKRCLTWFIHSAGYGFKMEIPFETITHTEFRHVSPGEGLASFHLSQPPGFFLENIVSPHSVGGTGATLVKSWKKCSDWTEGTQASLILRHDLIGSAVQLAHVLNDLKDRRTRSSIPLLNPTAYSPSEMLSTPVSAGSMSMQIPQPPLASLQSDAFSELHQRPTYFGHSRKRSNSGPPALIRNVPGSYADNFPPAGTIPEHSAAHPYSAGYTSTSFDRPSQIATYSYGQRVASDYLPSSLQPPHMQQTMQDPSMPDYSSVPISHGPSHRHFSSGPDTTHFFPSSRNSPPLHLSVPQHPSSQLSHIVSPSSPLVSSPYNAGPSMSVPGLSYFGHREPQGQGPRGSPSLDSGSLVGAFGTSSSSKTTNPPSM
ncbi:hypothetical protein M0805_007242 [Coniferiporia weirii]|nr:hypothetical protein M0805_007242 [Coniferiporia weirii]